MTPDTPTRTTRPTGWGRPHQNSAATTIAPPTRSSPTPSRRNAGSMSRVPVPIRRAPAPRAWASPSQRARTPRPTCCRADGRRGTAFARGRDPERPAGVWGRERPDRLAGRGCTAVEDRDAELDLLPDDRGRAPEPDGPGVLRDRGGEDARVAMLAGYAIGGPRAPAHAGHRLWPKWSKPPTDSQTAPSTSTPADASGSEVRTSPTTRQPSGTRSAAKVAARAWSSPPVSSSW